MVRVMYGQHAERTKAPWRCIGTVDKTARTLWKIY